MKKTKLLLFVIMGVLFLTGCNKTTKCTVEVNQLNYKIASEYKVIHDGENVVKIETEEIITSDDQAVLKQIEETLKKQMTAVDGIKYYDYSIKLEDNKVVQKVNVNYKKMDINKFLEVNPGAASMFQNGKIKYDTMLSIYNTLGVKCEE